MHINTYIKWNCLYVDRYPNWQALCDKAIQNCFDFHKEKGLFPKPYNERQVGTWNG